jgi:hypothetical protein
MSYPLRDSPPLRDTSTGAEYTSHGGMMTAGLRESICGPAELRAIPAAQLPELHSHCTA